MDAELIKVREEIRQADEALVRELVAIPDGTESEWEAQASLKPEFRKRVALGVKVAETKFRLLPGLFRPLAQARDEKGLDHAITCAKTEEAVLDRVRQAAVACGADAVIAARIVNLYFTRVIPETKIIQIRRLCELG